MSVAVVTGAASGMGRACAERFLAEGWQVAALDRVPADLDGALALTADITDADAVVAAVERAVAELGRAATPEEMADLVWFLAGEGRALYVTGETLTATGGSAFR